MAIETRTPTHSAIPTAESGLGPQHPRASGRSFPRSFPDDEEFNEEEGELLEDVQERGRRLAAASGAYAQSTWEAGREALEDGSRHARQWARRHPNQVWTAVGALSLLAIWLAYRPTVNAIAHSSFDPTKYRYRSPGARREGRVEAPTQQR